MPSEHETAEIRRDPAGAEALQQTLDALGVEAAQVNAAPAADSDLPQPPPDTFPQAEGTPPAVHHIQAPDQAELLAALNRQSEILERIAAALESQPPSHHPTY